MKILVKIALILTFTVILLGAYTRLTDAGLGCPDWPGCYGHLLVPMKSDAVSAANLAFPERPVESFKAWNEMIHRYFAGSLGLLILTIFAVAFKNSYSLKVRIVSSLLVGLVAFQAALGMWTVTMNLMPVVVMAHLLGGFSLFTGLFILHLLLRKQPKTTAVSRHPLTLLASTALVVLILQIALGGWTSTNYASLACTKLPICEPGWEKRITISEAFSVPEADNYEFGVHPYEARMTMHVFHRMGALVSTAVLLVLIISLIRYKSSNVIVSLTTALTILLVLQVLLGISNVVFSLPLVVAVAHNGVAALLLVVLVNINYQLGFSKQEVMYG